MTDVAHRLRQRHATALDSLVRHDFFVAAENGTLSASARDRYFVNERHFVGAARGIFALLLTKAPNLASARHLVRILDGLVNEQEPLFDRIYADLALEDPETPAPAARDLALGMTEIARDMPYVAGLAAMYVAEWSYAEVARRGDWAGTRDLTLRDWFKLHDQDAFLDGVAWLERELGDQWLQQNETAIDQAFRRAISLEIAFHADPLRAD